MVTATLTWMLPDGRCGGQGSDGKPVSVYGAVLGDTVEATREGRSSTLVRILQASSDRRTPLCPYAAECGGCDLGALSPEAQLQAKAAMVRHALRLDQPVDITPSPRPRGYRARITVAIRDGKAGFQRPRSHDHVPVPSCNIARPEVNEALSRLQEWLASHPSPTDRCEIRSDGERAVFAFTGRPGPVPDALQSLEHVSIGKRVVAGNPTLRLRVAGLALTASPTAFYQVNLEQNEALVAHVVQEVDRHHSERCLDLYCGMGNLTLPLAASGRSVVGVELPGAAVRDLQNTTKVLGWEDRVTVHGMDASRFDPSREAFDVAVLDPPRAGASGVLRRVVNNRPRAIVYVSCDIGSASRDIKEATRAGYSIDSVRAFDLFPDTHHVESVITLVRR